MLLIGTVSPSQAAQAQGNVPKAATQAPLVTLLPSCTEGNEEYDTAGYDKQGFNSQGQHKNADSLEKSFHRACSYGYKKAVRILLKMLKAEQLNKVDKTFGRTPFFVACCYGSTAVVKLLIQDQLGEVPGEVTETLGRMTQGGSADR